MPLSFRFRFHVVTHVWACLHRSLKFSVPLSFRFRFYVVTHVWACLHRSLKFSVPLSFRFRFWVLTYLWACLHRSLCRHAYIGLLSFRCPYRFGFVFRYLHTCTSTYIDIAHVVCVMHVGTSRGLHSPRGLCGARG